MDKTVSTWAHSVAMAMVMECAGNCSQWSSSGDEAAAIW